MNQNKEKSSDQAPTEQHLYLFPFIYSLFLCSYFAFPIFFFISLKPLVRFLQTRQFYFLSNDFLSAETESFLLKGTAGNKGQWKHRGRFKCSVQKVNKQSNRMPDFNYNWICESKVSHAFRWFIYETCPLTFNRTKTSRKSKHVQSSCSVQSCTPDL